MAHPMSAEEAAADAAISYELYGTPIPPETKPVLTYQDFLDGNKHLFENDPISREMLAYLRRTLAIPKKYPEYDPTKMQFGIIWFAHQQKVVKIDIEQLKGAPGLYSQFVREDGSHVQMVEILTSQFNACVIMLSALYGKDGYNDTRDRNLNGTDYVWAMRILVHQGAEDYVRARVEREFKRFCYRLKSHVEMVKQHSMFFDNPGEEITQVLAELDKCVCVYRYIPAGSYEIPTWAIAHAANESMKPIEDIIPRLGSLSTEFRDELYIATCTVLYSLQNDITTEDEIIFLNDHQTRF